MTENEERISVLLTKNPCKECSVKKCTRKCMFGILFEKAPGITRQEAIECMARAMFEWQRPGSRGDIPIEDVWQYEKCGFENLAEAALDALLSLQG